jgi:predicted HAD superfamily Cof-like phosphohydrolase
MGEEINENELDRKSFWNSIEKFNELYKMPVCEKPSLPSIKRLENFREVLQEEVDEVDEIIRKYREISSGMNNDVDKVYSNEEASGMTFDQKLSIQTDLADWLGDMMVYITSESRKYGFDMEKTLGIIMDSNFSKLDADGEPIYDERGKVQKGPNYWKPEEKISEMLKNLLVE